MIRKFYAEKDAKTFCLSTEDIKSGIKYTHVLGNMRKCPVTSEATDNPNFSTIKKNIHEKMISSLKNINSGISVYKKNKRR